MNQRTAVLDESLNNSPQQVSLLGGLCVGGSVAELAKLLDKAARPPNKGGRLGASGARPTRQAGSSAALIPWGWRGKLAATRVRASSRSQSGLAGLNGKCWAKRPTVCWSGGSETFPLWRLISGQDHQQTRDTGSGEGGAEEVTQGGLRWPICATTAKQKLGASRRL